MAVDDKVPAPVYEAAVRVLNAVADCDGRPVGAVTIVIFADKTSGIVPIMDASVKVTGGGDIDPAHAMLEDALSALSHHLEGVRAFEARRKGSN